MKIWLLLLLCLSPAWAQGERTRKLQAEVEQLARKASVGATAVAIVHLPSGEKVLQKADQPFPLASVFKVPVMIELCRQIQEGQLPLTLSSSLKMEAADRCIGSGSLQRQPVGTTVSLARLVELMEIRSDNTATDMLFRRIGLESVDAFMQSLGLKSSQIFLTNRAAWLISLGQSSDFRGQGPLQIAGRWQSMNREQRLAAARRAESENLKLSLSQFQALEDRSASRQSHAENVAVAVAVDNQASAADMAELLARLYQGKLLNSKMTAFCLDILERQKFNTRIPRLLPKEVRVFHKTGTIAGVVNDVGILEIAPGNSLVVAVLIQQVGENQDSRAEKLIADIARAAYLAYR